MSKVSRKQPEPGTAAFAAYTGYLASITQGDEVILCSGSPHFKCTFHKVTQTRDGQCLANSFWFSTVFGGLLTKAPIKHYILEPTEELKLFLARRQNEDFLCNLHPKLLADVPDTELEIICKLFSPYINLQCNKN